MENVLHQYLYTPQFMGRPKDIGYIDLLSEEDILYWTRELACTREELFAAVSSVGPLVVMVKRYLGSLLMV